MNHHVYWKRLAVFNKCPIIPLLLNFFTGEFIEHASRGPLDAQIKLTNGKEPCDLVYAEELVLSFEFAQ